MQDSFTSPAGFICVSYPDVIVPRPRTLPPRTLAKPVYTAQSFTDFFLSWLPTYTDCPPTHVPARPARVGVTNIFIGGIAPIDWLSTYPTYREAPRLHRVFFPSVFDPLSGHAMVVAASMVWDSRQKPIVLQPKVARTQFAYTPPSQIAAGSLTCTAMKDRALTVPTILNDAAVTPTMRTPALTVPAIITERLC